MSRRFHVRMEWDPEDEVFVTHVPLLNGLSTFARTREEALKRTQEAILGYLEALQKEGQPLPEDPPGEWVALEVSA